MDLSLIRNVEYCAEYGTTEELATAVNTSTTRRRARETTVTGINPAVELDALAGNGADPLDMPRER